MDPITPFPRDDLPHDHVGPQDADARPEPAGEEPEADAEETGAAAAPEPDSLPDLSAHLRHTREKLLEAAQAVRDIGRLANPWEERRVRAMFACLDALFALQRERDALIAAHWRAALAEARAAAARDLAALAVAPGDGLVSRALPPLRSLTLKAGAALGRRIARAARGPRDSGRGEPSPRRAPHA